ncbi:glycoside hydrolase family 5 protein [Prevotella sp. 10(H)]|uniref:glycoside hydrolase family 5 protein n=1 Tax=Prevotella sp. 10(H) TaxID=1158294 RepID=UPI0004A6DFB4|nr:glycoside hydrolase family 5 protein [Prevotella sp. 10(H)]
MNKILSTLFISAIAVSSVLAQKAEGGKNIYPFALNLAGADFGSNFPGVFNKDYTYPTVQDLDYMKKKGFALARIPFKWERIQRKLNGDLYTDDLSMLKTVVKEAEKRNIQVILDLHNYCRRYINGKNIIIGDEGLKIEHLADLWRRLAIEFKDYKNIYGYALMNEPHDLLDSTSWAKIAQACIIQIRKIDTKTPIIVSGDSWSSAERWLEFSDNLKNLYDPSNNLIFEAHVYFDKDASGSYKYSYDEEMANPYIGIERVQPFVKWLEENNFRGFIGEYGIPAKDDRWKVCLDKFLEYLQQKGINGAYWAAGPWWPEDECMAVKPTENYTKDKPQMKVLEKYLYTK